MMIPSYLFRHPEGPLTRQKVADRIDNIDHALSFIIPNELKHGGLVQGLGHPIPENLREKVDSLIQQRQEHISMLLPPAGRVPEEIWKKVFSYVPSAGLTLVAVSRMWRHTVLTMPEDLLANVPVFIRPVTANGTSNHIFPARMLRGKLQPNTYMQQLSVCILEHADKKALRILEAIPEGMTDIRLRLPNKEPLRIRLYAGPRYVIPLFGGDHLATKFIWEHLLELVIDYSNFTPRSNPNLLADKVSLEHITTLQRLTIHVQGFLTISRLVLPHNLEYLHLDDALAHSSDIVELLASSTSLRTLVLACHTNSPCADADCLQRRPKSKQKRICFPRLRQLVLIGGDRAPAMLSYLKTPLLQVFRLASYAPSMQPQDRYFDTGDDISEFIRVSECKIIRLELHSVFITERTMAHCLKALESITSLKVTDNGGLADMLRCLRHRYVRNANSEPAPQVPALEKLIVETNSPTDWPERKFNDFIQSRENFRKIMGEAKLCYTKTLKPFVVPLDISPFVSGMQNVFGLHAVKAPYMPKF